MAHLIVEQQNMFLPHIPKQYPFGAATTAFHHPSPPSALFASHNHNLPARSVAAQSNKRRLERDDEDEENGYGYDDEDGGRQDRRRRASPADAMDRSPTPERPRKAPPKRLRMAAASAAKDKDEHKQAEPEQDVGVLLARLPPQSLLPILTSLIQARPELKPVVLALIPRPTLEMATQALADAARKLRDAYPYSQAPTLSFASTSFGFGSGFAQPQRAPQIRDEYVLSRLRTPIADFVSTALSYLSYFSYAHPQSLAVHTPTLSPFEVYTYLAALTSHIFAQPPLAVNAVSAEIQMRLVEEWKAWVERIDQYVNKEGRMFEARLVQNWIDQLDSFAAQSQFPLGQQMKHVRDTWVARAGWLVQRNAIMSDL
ncbi:hypothetical protein EXIGLDRAFT_637066 [Exidia glandulosa HHB12029]|uniref:Tethering factor for nuclear proteasome STS1 n=1 Tax=Exidia glandulosa HHB12029 TaxID=1314781 RepID=A0A165PQY6_EXIGL|nr:hypothetical protein EXIGLDRAFT_637066 [Exidia glandulosa HHB12029]